VDLVDDPEGTDLVQEAVRELDVSWGRMLVPAVRFGVEGELVDRRTKKAAVPVLEPVDRLLSAFRELYGIRCRISDQGVVSPFRACSSPCSMSLRSCSSAITPFQARTDGDTKVPL
jgi:hypothetical protein